ncbi:DUF1461 domain-containing protein [Candidatus Woesearchaeota archaeon]|nr:DUF1461 domain-containing protein [Candidatus Woesearchaeota archaeon]
MHKDSDDAGNSHEERNTEDFVLKIVSAIVIVFLVFSASFLLVFFDHGFYDKSYSKYGAYENIGVEGIRKTTDYLTSYLISEKGEINSIPGLSVFTQDEKSHLQDVHRLFMIGKRLILAAIIILAIALRRTYVKGGFKRKLLGTLRFSAYVTAGALAILFILSLFGFDWMFLSFHQVFFPQGNYMFAVDSLIKTMYPDSFFRDFTMKIGFHALIMALILYFIGSSSAIAKSRNSRAGKARKK